MKKWKLPVILLVLVLLFTGCAPTAENDDPMAVDIDFTLIDDPYSAIFALRNDTEQYAGKTIMLTARFTAIYNFSTNKIKEYVLMATDKDGCCTVACQAVMDSAVGIPKLNTDVTVIGTFDDQSRITVLSWTSEDSLVGTYELDALTLSPEELTTLMVEFNDQKTKHEAYGTKIRICGNYTVMNGYKFLIGLDESGIALWNVELYEPVGVLEFPEVEGSYIQPLEVIGSLTVYYEDDAPYACIVVEQIAEVQCTLS